MKNLKFIVSVLIVSSFVLVTKAQNKSTFIEYQPGYYQKSILTDVRAVEKKLENKEVHKRFSIDSRGMDLPNKVDLYTRQWANPVISQGNAGTCWAFSTVSFMESEVKRIHNKKVKLSEIFTVYNEYIEKARGYVQTRGASHFSQGSEANAVTRIWSKYGTMPESEYTGKLHGRKFHSHEKMFNEMESYLKSLKISNDWNEEKVISTIKSIMNFYIGTPPANFVVDGKKYTPKTYLKDYLKINPNDYVDILSYKQEPYWKQVEYKVEDNWWHSKDYYNLPLDDFVNIIKDAVKNGYTMSIGGDVSEAGFDRATQTAIIPSFDIPVESINEDARQFRFSNKTTTDDHGMHLVGYLEKDGVVWYLVKDSSSGSRNNDPNAAEFGYYFFREDYVKLKIMDFMIHKDAVKSYLKRFK